ncbi:MAG: response regulator [Caulobacteraceae bacterium]
MAQEPLVLLLDDEFLIATVTGELLEDKGFAVITAGTPVDAIRVLDDLNEPVSALFLDIHLKDGATSFEVARAARRRFPEIAVLYTSGLPDAGFSEECVSGGQFIAKPYDANAVAGMLRAMTTVQRPEPVAASRASTSSSIAPLPSAFAA